MRPSVAFLLTEPNARFIILCMTNTNRVFTARHMVLAYVFIVNEGVLFRMNAITGQTWRYTLNKMHWQLIAEPDTETR